MVCRYICLLTGSDPWIQRNTVQYCTWYCLSFVRLFREVCCSPMVSSFRRRCVYCVCVCRSFSDVSLTHSRLTPHVSRPPTSNTSFLSFFVLCSRILDKVERLCLYGFMLYCMYVLYLYVIMVVYTVVCTVLMYCM